MPVKIWADKLTVPTYGVGEQNKNPMFLEKRVYQGSSGRVYPWPVIDKILDEKQDKEYTVVFIENEYVQVQVMPEIGGRIYRAVDKTNNYDFVYHNHVMKPALVGLTGPWVSGGIEFNWPQHHRPNTFGNVEYTIDDAAEGKKTVWLTERDRMYGTKVTTGISLCEGAAYIEIECELYNATGEPQTFLWWANPAVAVHDETQSIFPPDVCAVMDHGKRAVSKFPVATGEYYKTDYSKGVDISRYKNIPVPTSYMAYHSDFDFVGGYDYKADAGILHVADHHISPGKKQWTWGNGDFGQAWDRNLTDSDGPYIELMTGVFTDNQPDFTWLSPYSGKNFTQYFMPYKNVGEVKCANKDIVAGMKAEEDGVEICVYATQKFEKARIVVLEKHKTIFDSTECISPVDIFSKKIVTKAKEWELELIVEAEGAKKLEYKPAKPEIEKVPEPAKAIAEPEKLFNNEALFLAGIHLEQYRHATYEPDIYYIEGLKRDPEDIRINNAYGNLLYKRGLFAQAESHFEKAKKTATRHNPNPYDGEVFFNLGKSLEMQGKDDLAFDAYYKAIWSDAWRSQGYLKLAQISSRKHNYDEALEYAQQAMWAGYKNFSARAAVTLLKSICGNKQDAIKTAQETLAFDPMDFTAAYEMELMAPSAENAARCDGLFGSNPHNTITLAQTYIALGIYEKAVSVLREYISKNGQRYAMVQYYLAYCLQKSGDVSAAEEWKTAQNCSPDYCFPNMLEDYIVLKNAVEHNPADAKAYYYTGCFLYDKKRYSDAKDAWEKSCELDGSFPTVYRNLALYYANKQGDFDAAKKLLETAFELDETDARIFYELCELYKKLGYSYVKQLEIMESHMELIEFRDDLSVSYATALNGAGEHSKALDFILNHSFHPWEGGEGKVPAQHVEARLGIARDLISKGEYQQAADHLEQALIYYPNFGEGKLSGAQENNIYYTLGLAYEKIDGEKSKQCLEKASKGLSEPTGAMYYNDQPPHMIYYQGMALKALGREDEANARFNKLVSYGEKHIFEKQVMDYFAVSLPDFLVFETNLDDKNKVHCLYMMGLGYMGLGQKEKAKDVFEKALELEPGHYGVLQHLKLV